MPSEIKAWPPARYSPPLSEDFPSHADWLLPLIDLCYRLPDGSPIVLENWQRTLLRHVLEAYPKGYPKAGQLRYRQVLVSVARQNGKSVIGAILAIYGLLRKDGSLVIGLASSAKQANIVYKRVYGSLKAHPNLANRFTGTKTRGITGKNGSEYHVMAAKSDAVQGLDISVGILDELHIMPKELWTDALNGLGGRPNGLVFGITTAGDDNSVLLKELYKHAETGDVGETFGHFIWEAPDDKLPEDPEEFARYLKMANPSLAEGRIDLDTKLADALSNGPADQLRYNMNRFTAATAAFVRLDLWDALAAPELFSQQPVDPSTLVFALAASPEKTHATIVAAWIGEDTRTYTAVIGGVTDPRNKDLVRVCEELWGASPAKYVIQRNGLYGVAKDLLSMGYPVEIAGQGDEMQSSSHFYSLIAQKRLVHDGNPIMYHQLPRTVRKNVMDKFRISGPDSTTEVDGVYATAFACLYADLEDGTNHLPA